MQMQDILNVVENEFNDLNTLIHAQLESRVPLVEKVAEYIINSGGKRIRPLLVILTAKAFNQCDERAVKLATVIEFLHAATLDRKSTRLNSSHVRISYAVFCLKKKRTAIRRHRWS